VPFFLISAMKSKPHPLLRRLNLDDGSHQKRQVEDGVSSVISAADVLSYLLATNLLRESTVESALKCIRDQRGEALSNKPCGTANNGGKKPRVEDDSNVVRTRPVALQFFYDGANFSGLAQNMGREEDNSVERTLFEALLKARLVESREDCGYSRCGRTDRGVSAAGQVVALRLKSAFPLDASFTEEGTAPVGTDDLPKNEFESLSVWAFPRSKYRTDTNEGGISRLQREIREYPYAKILNNLLPPSIRVLGWTPVSSEFSARFSASTRTYRYFFCKRHLDLDAIKEGLNRLVGKHDFRNFCKMDVEKVYNFERVIHTAELVELSDRSGGDGVCYLQICGQAFLWHQIRCIAEVLFMIGRGLESPSVIAELLDVDRHPRKPSYNLADEKPLVLHDCGYPNLRVGYSVQNMWAVSCELERQCEDLILSAARLRNCIQSLRSMSVLREDLAAFVSGKLLERTKKRMRIQVRYASGSDTKGDLGPPGLDDLDLPFHVPNDGTNSSRILWGEALPWMFERGLIPDPSGKSTSVHIPLLERSVGTTYEEKVESVKKSNKRRQKFEDNVVKKRKTAEEDAAFYSHMMKQGGTGM
jgi:tRNA pseudouridine38/39 synthase